MSFWGEHSVHTVYCDLNWLAKRIKIIKINKKNVQFKKCSIFFFKKIMSFWGEHSVHIVYCDRPIDRLNLKKNIKKKLGHHFCFKNHVLLGGTLSPYSVL